jgi:hypothetical protein
MVANFVTDIEIPISQEVLRLIAEIDEFKGRWRALNALAPDRLAALRKVATIESIGSSIRIEGAKLSDILKFYRSTTANSQRSWALAKACCGVSLPISTASIDLPNNSDISGYPVDIGRDLPTAA